jgi:bifunctional DNA-binding transcriptional regulator/antitoxin component of YhaV-PrlF toxin-antitoxin module
MEKIVKFDKQGRIYIPEEMRTYLKFKTLVARVLDKSIILESIEEDPIEALGKLGREKLKGKSIKELKKQARENFENESIKKLR